MVTSLRGLIVSPFSPHPLPTVVSLGFPSLHARPGEARREGMTKEEPKGEGVTRDRTRPPSPSIATESQEIYDVV